MTQIGLSLGWNCGPAGYGVVNGIRKTKMEGYLTCPFDEMITNLPGIISCIDEDFKDFTNEKYLELILSKKKVGGIELNEKLIHNTKYNFIFNHESPGHADLYQSQSWSGGINHYIDNNFHLFKNRYERRISNFRNYIKNGQSQEKVVFILSRFNKNVDKLHDVLKRKYPNLNYEINTITPVEGIDTVKGHYELMGLSDDVIKIELGLL